MGTCKAKMIAERSALARPELYGAIGASSGALLLARCGRMRCHGVLLQTACHRHDQVRCQ
jgi:hypothetical protein